MRHWILALLLALPLHAQVGPPTQAQAARDQHLPPTVKVLRSSVKQILKNLREHGRQLRPADAERLSEVLIEQLKELETLHQRYRFKTAAKVMPLDKSLEKFFAAGARFQRMMRVVAPPADNPVGIQEYSPDPSQCANHCYQTCGYDSLGEKVCWFTCYACCGGGDC